MQNKEKRDMERNDKKKPAQKFDFYKSLHTWQDVPVTDNWKDALAQELFLWARDNEEAYKMSQFYLERGIHYRDFDRWCQTHEHLKTAKEAALILIGNRREIGGLKRKLDAGIVVKSMCRYDIEWKELAEWYAKLKSDNDNRPETKIIVMEQYNPPTTPLDEPLDEPTPLTPDAPTPEQVARKARKVCIGKNIDHHRKRR